MMGQALISQSVLVWWACQSSLVLGVGLLASYVLQRRAGRAGQLLLAAMIAALALLPANIIVRNYNLALPANQRPAQAPAQSPVAAEPFTPTAPLAAISVPADPIVIPRTIAPSDPSVPQALDGSARIDWNQVLLCAWVVVSLALFARLFISFVRGNKVIKYADPIHDATIQRAVEIVRRKLGLATSVDIRSSGQIRTPALWCWCSKPILLIPAGTSHQNSTAWEGIICHELAHWRRYDHIAGLVAEIAVCLVPWQPLMWWAKRRLGRLSEQACDDWVVACGTNPVDYAESLLKWSPEAQMAFIPTVVASKKELDERIRRLLQNPTASPRAGLGWTLTVAVLISCLTAGLALAQAGDTDRSARAPDKCEAEVEIERKPCRISEVEERHLAIEREELLKHRQQLLEQVHELEGRLTDLGDSEDDLAHRLQNQLEELRDQIRRINRRLDQITPPAFGREARRPRRAPHQRELLARLRDLQMQAEAHQRELAKLRDKEGPQAQQIREELHQIRANIERIQHELERSRFEEPRPPRWHGERAEHLDRLVERRRDLQQEAEQLHRALERIGDKDGPEARQIRRNIAEIHKAIAEIEHALEQARRGEHRPQVPEVERERAELLRHREMLLNRAEEIHRQIRELGDRPEAEELRAELRDIEHQLEIINRELAIREPREPWREGELREQLGHLQDQVNELREQMHEMRELLQQLLERMDRRQIERQR